METTVERILGERVRVTPAGRTDTGVHAAGQVVSFQTRGRLPSDEFCRALNALLPDDMQVDAVAEMPVDFDARRRALRRHYRYAIWNRPRRDFWSRRWSWHVPDAIDYEAMERATATLVGKGDFAAFAGKAAREPAGRTTVRTLEYARWQRDRGFLVLHIGADAFLRHMVRGLVGTLVWVGQGRISPEEFAQIVESRDRRRAGPNAPAHGLILVAVDYPAKYELPPSRERSDAAAVEPRLPTAPVGERSS